MIVYRCIYGLNYSKRNQIAKDSPHPQVPFAFGLLNTKCSESLSWTKSISLPKIVISAFESTSTVTPIRFPISLDNVIPYCKNLTILIYDFVEFSFMVSKLEVVWIAWTSLLFYSYSKVLWCWAFSKCFESRNSCWCLFSEQN